MAERQPKRYTWKILLAALLAMSLGGAGLCWCGSGDGHDPAWDKAGDVIVPSARGPYEYESQRR